MNRNSKDYLVEQIILHARVPFKLERTLSYPFSDKLLVENTKGKIKTKKRVIKFKSNFPQRRSNNFFPIKLANKANFFYPNLLN